MAATPREERLALNEALFRAANERMAGWDERHTRSDDALYFCECADPDCRVKIALVKPDYERVRAHPRLFFVAPGHEMLEVEKVVERHEDWLIVEKPPEVDDVIDPLDPRRAT